MSNNPVVFYARKPAILLGLLSILLTLCVQVWLTGSAHATVTLSPDPGAMPTSIRDYLEGADGEANSPTIASWATPASDWYGDTMNVTFGQTTVSLVYNGAATVGWTPSSTTATRFYVEGADAGVGGLIGNFVQPVLAPNQNVVGATDRESIAFTYTRAGGFTSSGWYYISIDTKIINSFSGGFYRCVDNGASASSLADYGACPVTPIVLGIYINVLPEPPSGSFSMTCSASTGVLTITADASDSDSANVTITADVSGTGSDPSNYSGATGNGLSIGTVNRPPDGSTYTVTGTVSDGTTTVDMAADSENCPRPPTTWECRAATVPGGSVEVGTTFELEITIENTSAQYALPMSSTTHPVAVSASPSVSGLGPASERAYSGLGSGDDVTVTDSNLVTSTADIYTFTVTVGGQACPTSVPSTIIGNRSYLKSYGGDVWAGASFQSPCTFTSGSIDTFAAPRGTANGLPTYAGSSAQFSVTALMTINEFYSVSNRVPGVGNTFPPKGLTFGNSGAGAPSTTYGGGYGAAYPRCMPDYYTDTRGTTVQSVASVTNASFGPAGPIQFDLGNGNHTIGSLTVPSGRQVVIFAEGNVYLNGTIQYATAPRATIADIPSFALIVRGNIYVDNDVNRLDGTYIAQPAAGAAATQGRFYTCARQLNPPRLYTAAEIYANCGGQAGVSGQLVINGGVIAQQVRLLRTFGTLRDAVVGEVPDFATGAGTQAGEVFNYTAEMFMAPSALERPRQRGSYDAITSLPPIY